MFTYCTIYGTSILKGSTTDSYYKEIAAIFDNIISGLTVDSFSVNSMSLIYIT